MELILPVGTIIWEKGNLASTIDLVFTTERLREAIIYCDTAKELDQSFDHIPIKIAIQLEADAAPTTHRMAWKSMNSERLKAEFPEHPRSWQMNTSEEINKYVGKLTSCLQKAVNASGSRPGVNFGEKRLI